jgi:hypothetical protein
VKKSVLLVLASWVLVAPVLFAVEKVNVADIKNNPKKYFNKVISCEGYVVQVIPLPNIIMQGRYLLEDMYGDRIEVKTRDLPQLGRKFTVIGEVISEEITNSPIIVETKRKSYIIPWPFYAAAGTLIAILAVILILLLIPAKKEAPYEELPKAEVPTKDWIPPEVATLDYLGTVEVIDGDPADKGKKFEIVKPITIIGRGRHLQKGDIRLEAETISREHARLIAREGTFEIINLSKNPMLVDGKPVNSHILKNGDIVQLAGTVLKFKLL